MNPSDTARTYRPELDGIRGLAILAVLVQHANLPNTLLAGTVGVNVFFVLSGFLITSTLLAEHASTGRVSIRAFYERRVRRLLPALIATLVAVGAILAVLGGLGSYPIPLVASVFYVSDIVKSAGLDLGFMNNTWSLAVEEQFYLLWPLLLIVLPRRFLVPAVIGGILVAVALQLVLIGSQGNVLAMFRPDVRMDSILWGCLLALVPVRVPRLVAVLCLGGLAILAVTNIWPYALALSSILGAGVVAGAASMRGLLANRVLVRIGAISYGLYLWQALPAGLLHSQIMRGDLLASADVIVLSIALALISERWIEMPFRRRRSTAARGAPTRTPVVATLRRVALPGAATELGAGPQRAPGFLRSEGLG